MQVCPRVASPLYPRTGIVLDIAVVYCPASLRVYSHGVQIALADRSETIALMAQRWLLAAQKSSTFWGQLPLESALPPQLCRSRQCVVIKLLSLW